MGLFEPQIPEYPLLVARRHEQAVARGERVRQWEAAELAYDLSGEKRRQVRQERTTRRQALARVADLVPVGYRQFVLDVASRYDLDPRLIAAVGTVESQWYARARGTSGDSGLMQIIPATAAWISRRMGLSDYDLYDPLTNLSMGAWYLQALQREHGSWDRALAAYNGGPKAAVLGSRHPYVRRVRSVYDRQGSQ